MSSIFKRDQKYLAWNFFMLHLLNDCEFSQINNPISLYPEWVDCYANKVINSMANILKDATRETASYTPEMNNIPQNQFGSSIPINNLNVNQNIDEPYQGLLMVAPQFGIPSSPSSISSESSFPFSDRDSTCSSSSSVSASDEIVPTFSKVIARPVPIPIVRPPSSGYITPTTLSSTSFGSLSSSSSSSSAAVISGDLFIPPPPQPVRKPFQRRRRGGVGGGSAVQGRQQPQPPQQQKAGNLMCSFCRRNSEPKEFYTNHNTKDSHGNVICPILFAYKCEACGATGRDAHTRSHCPMASVIRSIFNDDSTVQMRYANYARTARNPQQ